MKLTFRTTTANKITKISLKEQLYATSFKNRGYMWSNFTEAQEIPESAKKMKVCYVKHFAKLIGWGIGFFDRQETDQFGVMLYVQKDYRRKGIGTKIFKKLCRGKKLENIQFWAEHSKESRCFFKKNVHDKTKKNQSRRTSSTSPQR